MMMFSSISNTEIYRPNYIVQVLAVIILTLLAGRSINSFIRKFLLPAVFVFILLPCLPLFKDYRYSLLFSVR